MRTLFLLVASICISATVGDVLRDYCPCSGDPDNWDPELFCDPPEERCELVDDVCGCCKVCAIREGETCGFNGRCETHLECHKQATVWGPASANLFGTCRKVPQPQRQYPQN